MPESRVSVSLQNDSDYKIFNVQGTGPTIAAARGEAKAKVALIADCTILSVSESTSLDGAAAVTAGYLVFGPGENADATLTLRKGLDRATTRTINLKDMTTTMADSVAADGSIDKNQDLITGFGTAYYDAEGNNGYTVIRGSFSD